MGLVKERLTALANATRISRFCKVNAAKHGVLQCMLSVIFPYVLRRFSVATDRASGCG